MNDVELKLELLKKHRLMIDQLRVQAAGFAARDLPAHIGMEAARLREELSLVKADLRAQGVTVQDEADDRWNPLENLERLVAQAQAQVAPEPVVVAQVAPEPVVVAQAVPEPVVVAQVTPEPAVAVQAQAVLEPPITTPRRSGALYVGSAILLGGLVVFLLFNQFGSNVSGENAIAPNVAAPVTASNEPTTPEATLAPADPMIPALSQGPLLVEPLTDDDDSETFLVKEVNMAIITGPQGDELHVQLGEFTATNLADVKYFVEFYLITPDGTRVSAAPDSRFAFPDGSLVGRGLVIQDPPGNANYPTFDVIVPRNEIAAASGTYDVDLIVELWRADTGVRVGNRYSQIKQLILP
jgi:hypothetical protein